MINVYISELDGDVHFKVEEKSVTLFDEITEVFRSHYCKFNSKTKEWIYPISIDVLTLLTSLKSYEPIISDDDLEVIKLSLYPPSNELKKIKYKVDEELIKKHPPLVGKKGFENFQYDAISKLVKTNRAICDISCRHGKSMINCMAFGTLYKLGVIDKIFIVCRNEGVQNFYSEILFFLDGLFTEDDIAIVTTKNREIENYFDKKIIITNYITFRLSCEYYSKSHSVSNKTRNPTIDFSKWGNHRMIILDEIQSINSYDSIQSHLLHLHKNYFEYRYGLSGTLGYNFFNWYSLAKFMLSDRMTMSFSSWRDYISPDRFHKIINEYRAKEFKEKILDKILITYHDCIVETEDEEIIQYCVMSDKMRKLYKDVCNKFVVDIFKENDNPNANSVLRKFGELSSFTSDPSLKECEDWKFEDNPKLDVLDGLLDKYINEENRRVIIWGVHPTILNKLNERYKKYKPLVVHGDEKTSVKREDRTDELEKFKEDESRKILFTNKVFSTSQNIVECSVQIFWDLPLSSDDFNQSIKRIRGPKQKQNTKTIILLFDNSCDLYIWNEIVQKKEKTRKAMLSKDKLNPIDLKNLLNPTRKYYVDGEEI